MLYQESQSVLPNYRAVILATGAGEGELAPLLKQHRVDSLPCRNLREVSEKLGDDDGLLIAAEESLAETDLGMLTQWLARQPSWSDLPVILLTTNGAGGRAGLVERLSNVTLLARPIQALAFSTLLDNAIRTRRRQHECRDLLRQLGESETRFSATFENGAVGIGHVAPDGRWLRVNQTLCRILGRDRAELLAEDAAVAFHADDRGRFAEMAAGLHTYSNVRPAEVRAIRQDGSICWLELSGDLARSADGQPVFSVWIVQDISARKRAVEQRRTLLRELSHRVKNTLAVIQAMAKQTARATQSKQDFLTAFEGRIAGLAHTHNVLTDADWSGADLRTLVERQLHLLAAEGVNRIEIDGPPVLLTPAGATSLAMVVHELATNARRHGALSVERGRLQVRWAVASGPDGQHLNFTWRELDGPPVRKPVREGFGMKLLRSSGKVVVRYGPTGFECDIDVPLRPDAAFVEPAEHEGQRP